jgi:adenylate cyclase
LRRDLIDPAIEEHGGRGVQTGGDSLLIVFDSIDGAVRCAVKVQQQVPYFDDDQPPDRAIRFRIGINIGDAIADGTDLHGDAVNVVARLQAECPPGSICVSRSVRDHMHGRLELEFEGLGPLNLKNIAQPIEAFLVKSAGNAGPSQSGERSLVHGSGGPLPLPDRPSIAVLAFTNMSGDAEQEYFSDGISDDIITDLSRSRSLFVIARNSSFTYKGRPVDVKQMARELGVRYVVEGSVRRSGDRVRIAAQLIDAERGSHIWAERYDREAREVFAVQDEITVAVAAAIEPAIAGAEQRRALRKPPESLTAWETYQRGLWHLSKGTPVDNEQARLLFRQAGELDPGFAAPYLGLAQTYMLDAQSHGIRTVAVAAKMIEVEARKALAIDPDVSDAHKMLAQAFVWAGKTDAALDRLGAALTLNRNSAAAIGLKGAILTHSGRYADGRNELLMSLRLNPRDPAGPMVRTAIAASYYFEGNYAKAIEAAWNSLSDHPAYASPRRFLVAALGQLGRKDEAAAALTEWLEVAPEVLEVIVRNLPPYMRPEDQEHLLDGLRKAGWQG